MSDPVFAFGHCEFLPNRRLLLGSGRRLRLGSRAFDLTVAWSNKPSSPGA